MSAAGRLWRRAPAWRFALLSGIALTGLAAMFPPALPPLRWPGVGAGSGPEQARFAPVPMEKTGGGAGIIQWPPPGSGRSGLVPFAGRTLPLPAGSWQTVGVASLPEGIRQLILARVEKQRLTGMMLVTGTGAFGGPAGPVGVPLACGDPSRLAGAIVPGQPGQSPLVQECWSLVSMDMKAVAGGDSGAQLKKALALLGQVGTAVPDKMLLLQFVRSTDRGWQNTGLLLPDAGGTVTALSAWAGRYQALLHRGFDGTATAADLTRAATTKDPG